MESVHFSHLGFANPIHWTLDRDQYAHFTAEAVLGGSWNTQDPEDDFENPDEHLRQWAEDVAERNRQALEGWEMARRRRMDQERYFTPWSQD